MKNKKKSYFGLGAGKFFVILLVVLASVFFIWQYVFVQNSKESNAIDNNTNICCGRGEKDECPAGYSCQGVPLSSYFQNLEGASTCKKTCQPKNYRRPR